MVGRSAPGMYLDDRLRRLPYPGVDLKDSGVQQLWIPIARRSTTSAYGLPTPAETCEIPCVPCTAQTRIRNTTTPLACIRGDYGSEGQGFESLQARQCLSTKGALGAGASIIACLVPGPERELQWPPEFLDMGVGVGPPLHGLGVSVERGHDVPGAMSGCDQPQKAKGRCTSHYEP
jgi:hypothetical protein